MKQVIWLLLLLLLAVSAFADQNEQEGEFEGENPLSITALGDMEFPIASVDNLFIPLVNPALNGTGNSEGLGWAQLYDANKLKKHYWLFANLDGLSYVYEYDKTPDGKSFNNHTLSMGSEMLERHIFPNLYGGTSYRWRNSKIGKGDWRSGLTYRPHDSTSLAFTWDNPQDQSPAYRFGAAIRPLAFVPAIADQRLELSADFSYNKEGDDYQFRKPTLGIQTQILNGLNLGGSYNLENETAQLAFSLSFQNTDIGAVSRTKSDDYYSIPYIHLTDDAFLPFLGIKQKNWYNMKLKGSVVSYKAPEYTFGPIKIYNSDTRSMDSIIKELKKAKQDETISGIMLKNPGFSTSYALMQELTNAVKDFKSSGKTVAFYYDNISNGGYIFASSVADKIYLNPTGTVDLRGISISSPYLKGLLSSLGIDVLNFRSHKYKSAGNMFSETEMTEAEREEYESLLQSIYNQMLATLAAGRGNKLKSGVEETINAGPYYLAQDALDAGLVDELVFEEELDDKLKEAFGFSGSSGLADYRDYDWAKPKQNLIAVIYASGNIVMGEGTPGQKIAHKTTVDLIRDARKNKAYKGIILRVDSGGGSAQASDIILHEMELAQTENKKPVVVSMAGVAASGGYYISCKADKIVADPATLTGSIGVIGLAFSMERFYDKIKVNWSTVKKGDNADFGSTTRPWTDEEKRRMEGYIEATYEDFVGKVDKGRQNLSLERVHELAQGRVWTGEQALANGLIDELGGMDVALEQMRALTGIQGNLTLVDATSSEGGITVQMSGNPLMSLPGVQLIDSLGSDYLQVYQLWKDYHSDQALMLSPLKAEPVQF